MKSYNLEIAGYRLRFESTVNGPDLVPSEKFVRSIVDDIAPDVRIRVHSGSLAIPVKAERVFHAPFVEEIDGNLVESNPDFWSVWHDDDALYIKTNFPLSIPGKNAVLKLTRYNQEWDLWVAGAGNILDPLEYPLDGLILYYLTVINGDIMIHASGVTLKDKGYLFSGISGKGKSTMAKLWENAGAKVIHDDRLIIRKRESNFLMFNTPVYPDDKPLNASLNRIFIIDHGIDNKINQVTGASAVSLLLANCIQHNWDKTIISGLLESISDLCRTLPVALLSFRPDKSVIDYILENVEEN
jgi:hypothetical protein